MLNLRRTTLSLIFSLALSALASNPFEPTITREEGVLIKTAMEAKPAEALRMLNAVDREKASPAIDFAIGNIYFQEKQLDEAAEAYRAALEKQPKFRRAMMNLGRIYLLQENPEKAIALYQQLVSDGQADADILLLLGHALLLENAPVSAESAYRQTLLLRPKDDSAMLGLAKALMRQERYAESLALVGEILLRDPANRELWTLRINAYLSMGKQDEAIRAIEKARRIGCADPEMLATLGDLLLNLDQPVDALAAYQSAFAGSTPNSERMLRAIEGFLMTGAEESAKTMIEQAESALASNPSQKLALLRLKAELAVSEQRLSEAEALCNQILRRDPLDGKTLLLLAGLQQQENKLAEAIITCERAARLSGFEAEALIRQAQIEVQRAHCAQAIALLEAAQTFKDQPHVARYLEQLRRMVR